MQLTEQSEALDLISVLHFVCASSVCLSVSMSVDNGHTPLPIAIKFGINDLITKTE